MPAGASPRSGGSREAAGRAAGPERPEPGTEAAARVADVLLLFTGKADTLGVTEIAQDLALSKAVVHRILTSLASRGLIAVDADRRYHLGPAAAVLGARALRDLDLRAVALPVLRRLRDASRETTTLSVVVGEGRTYVDQLPSPQEIRMLVEIGRRFPLHRGASSKVILAFLPPDTRQRVRDAVTGDADSAALARELDGIRIAGFAVSRAERQPDTFSVAAPLLGVDGHAVGAISICGPLSRLTDEASHRHEALVTAGAEEVSRQLGWTG